MRGRPGGQWAVAAALLSVLAASVLAVPALAQSPDTAQSPRPRPAQLGQQAEAPAAAAADASPAPVTATAADAEALGGPPGAATDPGPPPANPPLRVAPSAGGAAAGALAQAVLTVDQEAIYRQSRWGQRAQQEIAAQSRQVAADNERAFAELVADEDALTAARATLSPDEFRSRATAFDERVTAVRTERDAAREALAAMAERDRAIFFQAAAPVLGRIMSARGALVVLDQRTVLISDERTDITAATVAALDAELGDGSDMVAAAIKAAAEAGAETSGPAGTDGTAAAAPDEAGGADATTPTGAQATPPAAADAPDAAGTPAPPAPAAQGGTP